MTQAKSLYVERDETSRPVAAIGPGAGLEFVKAYFPRAGVIRIASAYFSISGYQLGKQHSSADAQFSILVGKEEGGNVTKAVLQEIQDELQGCDTDLWEAITDLVARIRAGQFVIKDARSMRVPFHCKFYIVDRAFLWHGSANYSKNGLLHNAEQVTGTAADLEISLFTRWYDAVASEARDLLTDILLLLEAWLCLARPFEVYLKILERILGLSYELKRGEGAHAPLYFQNAVISRAITTIREYSGSLIVLATGLGKTVVGAELAERLIRSEEIDELILLAPHAVRDHWVEQLHGRKILLEFYPTDALFRPDSHKRHHLLPRLMKRLNSSGERTLIIIDEVHFYRNQIVAEKQKKQPSRVFSRFGPVARSGAKIALLTATAYGTNRQNLNSLLRLLPPRVVGMLGVTTPWQVESAAEFRNLPVVTVLGLPEVLRLARDREDVEADGQPFFEVRGRRRYYPERIRRVPCFYELPLQEEIKRAFESSHFNQVNKVHHLDFDDETGQYYDAVTDPGFNTALNSWISSPMALREFIEISLEQGEPPQLAFEISESNEQRETPQLDLLATSMHEQRYAPFERAPEVRRAALEPLFERLDSTVDDKLAVLVRLVHEWCIEKNTKAIVFVRRRRTGLYLARMLQGRFPELATACTIQDNGKAQPTLKNRQVRNEILQQFSPRNADPANVHYDLLICTDADGVGVNLEDADVVVNYDPPQAADVLFQRVGRVMRMTSRRNRVVNVYTLIPSVATDESAVGVYAMVRKRFAKLRTRHDRSTTITGSGLLSHAEEVDLLHETTTRIEDWFREGDLASSLSAEHPSKNGVHWAMWDRHRKEAAALREPLHSSKLTGRYRTPRVIVLFDSGSGPQLILFNINSGSVEAATTEQILELVSCEPDENPTPVRFSEIEHQGNRAITVWCEANKADPAQAKKTCVLYLQPLSNQPGARELLARSVINSRSEM